MFIQYELLETFTIENTAIIIEVILSVSRIIRFISNVLFQKIYTRYQEKISVFLPVLLFFSIFLLIIGSFLWSSILLKIVIMGLGYIILLFIRDPFKVYIQHLALNTVEKENQQSILNLLELSRKIVKSIVSLSFTFIFVHHSLLSVMFILLILSILQIFISIKLYKLILISKNK